MRNMISVIITSSLSIPENFNYFNKYGVLLLNNFSSLIKDISFLRVYWYYVLFVSLFVNPSFAFYLVVKSNKCKNIVEFFYSYMNYRKTNRLHYAILPFLVLENYLKKKNV